MRANLHMAYLPTLQAKSCEKSNEGNRRKINRKSTKNRSRHTSCASHATVGLRKALFSSSDASKWSPRALRGALGGLLGPTGALLDHSWITLGSLLGRSWALLRALGALSGHSWSDLGGIMIALGIAWTILDRPWVDCGRSSSRF